MATAKERLQTEQEKLRKAETILASAKQAAELQGKDTSPAIEKGSKEVARLKKSVANLRKQVTAAEEKPLTSTQKKAVSENAVKEALPFQTDDRLLNEIRNIVGPNLSADMFKTGGVGANIFVYQGQRKGTSTSPTGAKYTTKVDDVVLSNDVINSFWTDKTVQKKVINALVAAGNSNATQLDAFATWQSVVQQSANLYAAGKGPKFTPMDILNMSMTKAGGRPDVTTYLDVPKDNELRQILKNRLFEVIRKEPDDKDPVFQNLFNDIKKLYQRGETTTTTVDPKTGRKTVKRTGGVTDAMVKAKIDKYYNENNQDFLEAKSLEATDYFSQWMRS